MLDPEQEPREDALPTQQEDPPVNVAPVNEFRSYPSEYPLVAQPEETIFSSVVALGTLRRCSPLLGQRGSF